MDEFRAASSIACAVEANPAQMVGMNCVVGGAKARGMVEGQGDGKMEMQRRLGRATQSMFGLSGGARTQNHMHHQLRKRPGSHWRRKATLQSGSRGLI